MDIKLREKHYFIIFILPKRSILYEGKKGWFVLFTHPVDETGVWP